MVKAKVKKRKGRSLAFHGAAEVRRTTFGGLPIVDADADFTLVVRDADVKAAQGSRLDFSNCVLAKACRRQVGASVVAFFRTIAYVDLPDHKGKRNVVRFYLDNDAAAIVKAFDRGKAVAGEVTVKLLAPRPSNRLEAVRQHNKERRERQSQALLKGEIYGNPAQARFARKPRVADMDIRNGSGKVQMTPVQAV
jgi:hypothetical protein